MSEPRTSALRYAKEHREYFLDEFKDFLSIASISTDPTKKPEIEKAAAWLDERVACRGPHELQIEWLRAGSETRRS